MNTAALIHAILCGSTAPQKERRVASTPCGVAAGEKMTALGPRGANIDHAARKRAAARPLLHEMVGAPNGLFCSPIDAIGPHAPISLSRVPAVDAVCGLARIGHTPLGATTNRHPIPTASHADSDIPSPATSSANATTS